MKHEKEKIECCNEPKSIVSWEGIVVDEEGTWYYQGQEIFRKEILKTFFEHIGMTGDGRFYIEWKGSRYSLEAADTPFVITRVDRIENETAKTSYFQLTLKHLDDRERLDPSTLWIDAQNVLHCRIRNGAFPARFLRPAYYQMAQWIEQDPETGRFFVEVDRRRYWIALP